MKKKLFKSILIFSFLLITFFSVKHNDIEAASFAYADFNWKNFLEQHKDKKLDVVEIDPELVEIAKEYFNYEENSNVYIDVYYDSVFCWMHRQNMYRT